MAEGIWEVRTTYGPVAGRVADGTGVFRGIPYAAPPVGPHRFGPPVPPEPWHDTLAADAFGPTPPRSTAGLFDVEASGEPVPGDGWLTVNVWAPRERSGPLPVMVWIHGGAFLRGSSAGTLYDGSAFARDGVVLVSLNYRLGVEGFGYIQGAPAPANRGLLDQLFALQWVRDNIAGFGGDPGNVTVFGESAGAMSILALLSTGTDLFHKAIVQSGSASLGQSVDDARLITAAVAEELGIDAGFDGFRTVDPGAVIEAQQRVHQLVVDTADAGRFGATTIASCGMSFLPVVDGDLLAQAPIDAIRSGAGSHVTLLLGTNTEEHRFFVAPYPGLIGVGAEAFKARLAQYGVPGHAYDAYAAADEKPYTRDTPAQVFAAVMTDRIFRIPSYRVAEARSAAAPTFVYEFGWRSPATISTELPLGAAHIVEIPFVWDNLGTPGADGFIGTEPPAELARTMHGRWVEFARTGAPEGWPAYGPDRAVLAFAKHDTPGSEVVHDPRSGERWLWEGVEFLPGLA
ncbi:carboxylesterase/lipase family protein [Yinghuangia soli]|uniref:Carboxylic ester hydrolase n=1 Tax=Yinghuangia soli TaxID=2908204 RepID=A0AA41Q0P5_9ACTN|nr:carboxylesterase family protein [Yinghuangia soli]MCF2528815.1 carboxylesterase family protein [Yinghuangia soli]